MKQNNTPHSEQYSRIINEVNSRCDQLHSEHQQHTKCKQGCSKCCMDFSLLPVEFHSILDAIRNNPPTVFNENEGCIFLVDNSCTIYEHRPSICRSHGLPILNMDSEGENWELSYCPLNFTKVDDGYFTLDNGFQQDLFNSKLYLANRKFIQHYSHEKYNENELIEMRRMIEYL